MSHIFISYSRSDIDIARYIRASLAAEGFPVWMDEHGLSAGMDWWDTIEANIDACSAFLVLMSTDSRDSVYVRNEILRALDQKKPLFPVLLSGKPFSLLAHAQYEDMRGGLTAKLTPAFIQSLREIVGDAPARKIRFEIVHQAAQFYECDAIALKYAAGFHGADRAVAYALRDAKALELSDFHELEEIGDYRFYETGGSVHAHHALFVRTNWVGQFGYRQIREFSSRSLSILARELGTCKHLAMTIHGVNSRMKLDESETLLAQLAGIVDAIRMNAIPQSLERISIVEYDGDRVARLQKAVTPFFEEVEYASAVEGDEWAYQLNFGTEQDLESPDAGREDVKPYAFVLMPENADLEDIFYYGIQRPIHAMGLLCERATSEAQADTPAETPENKEAVLERISRARALVCDVSDINPKLYLNVGFALGKGIPVAFISRKDNPDFETIRYQKIWELEERLAQWLKSKFV